jgi:hypothetical protein
VAEARSRKAVRRLRVDPLFAESTVIVLRYTRAAARAPQSRSEASLAPSARAWSLAH